MKYGLVLLMLTSCTFTSDRRTVHILCWDNKSTAVVDKIITSSEINLNTLSNAKDCAFLFIEVAK